MIDHDGDDRNYAPEVTSPIFNIEIENYLVGYDFSAVFLWLNEMSRQQGIADEGLAVVSESGFRRNLHYLNPVFFAWIVGWLSGAQVVDKDLLERGKKNNLLSGKKICGVGGIESEPLGFLGGEVVTVEPTLDGVDLEKPPNVFRMPRYLDTKSVAEILERVGSPFDLVVTSELVVPEATKDPLGVFDLCMQLVTSGGLVVHIGDYGYLRSIPDRKESVGRCAVYSFKDLGMPPGVLSTTGLLVAKK